MPIDNDEYLDDSFVDNMMNKLKKAQEEYIKKVNLKKQLVN